MPVVLADCDDCLARIDALVLAGGLGTRIRPVLGDIPKLLAPIGRRTYLDHLLDWLASFGAHRVVLGLGHLSNKVTDHLHAHPRSDVALSWVAEPTPLGTAGAIRFVRPELRSDPVLIINGDSFADVDLCAMLRSHCQRGASATILCAEVGNANRYGRVQVDAGGVIQGFLEKEETFHGPAVVNAGIYFLSAKLLDHIAAGSAKSLEREVFEREPAGSLAAFFSSSGFIDIGTPESFAQAEEFFSRPLAAQQGTERVS
jgi:NDP-sugar pyrophosphorylase family protein